MTPANESGINVVESIFAHPTNHRPDLVPVWARWDPALGFVQRTGKFEWAQMEQLRNLGMEPVIYAETGGMLVMDIFAGRWDEHFRLLAARARGSAIRILHENNGRGLFDWQDWTVPQFITAWQRIARIFHSEGARIIYCVSARGKRDDDLLERWPGGEHVDITAFDEFRRSDSEPLPPQHAQWRYSTEVLGSKGKPIWVCETGAEASTKQRGSWMASLDQVKGVAAILVFDFRIEFPPGKVDDWSWNGAMVRQWDLLVR